MAANRIFTHPVPPEAGRLHVKHFRKQAQGVYQGTRMTQIESKHPAVNKNYQHGIMIENVNGTGQPQIFFGDFQTVTQIAQQLKKGEVQQVAQQLRPTGQSQTGMHYLNKPAPGKLQADMTPEQIEKSALAHTLYPKQGEPEYPRSVPQEEKFAMKKQNEKVAADKQMYPSSAEGQQAIKEATQPVSTPGSTALSGGE